MIRPFLLAVQFLTRVPVRLATPTEKELRRASAFYPLVGALVGAGGAGVYWVAAQVLPGNVSVVLAMIFLAVVTGGLHEDGLADCADAFGAARDRPRILEILRDSRLGAFGTLALVLVVLLKFVLLVSIPPDRLLAVLILAHCISRWLVLPVALLLPRARTDGLGADFGRQVGALEMIAATILMAVVGAAFRRVEVIFLLPLPVLAVALWSFFAYRRIGGYTGDVLGASVQLAEVSIYLSAVALNI